MKKSFGVHDMVYIGMFAVLMTICSWLSIPSVVPFTLQTFAVFCALFLLGGKRTSVMVLVYILLGIAGLPVFSGFRGGVGTVLGATGGYLIGFLPMAMLYWLITKIWGEKLIFKVIAMTAGLVICYFFGTLWFAFVYMSSNSAIGILAVIMKCVAPFIIPDIIKMLFAVIISSKLSKHIRL